MRIISLILIAVSASLTEALPQRTSGVQATFENAFGKKVQLRPINAESAPISQSIDLNCDFYPLTQCGWSNAKNNTMDWTIVNSKVDGIKFKKVFNKPKLVMAKPFAAVASGHDTLNTNEQSTLVSSQIPCQSGTGRLNFTHYLTDGVIISVCRRGLFDPTVLQPCSMVQGVDRSSVGIDQHPSGQPMLILLTASNFKTGSVAAIDSITYQASLCGQGSQRGQQMLPVINGVPSTG